MGIYKITNTTNKIDKRQQGFNSLVLIDYVNNMEKQSKPLNAGETLFIEISALPISIHKLRAKNMISVSEASRSEMLSNVSTVYKQLVPVEPVVVEKPSITKKIR